MYSVVGLWVVSKHLSPLSMVGGCYTGSLHSLGMEKCLILPNIKGAASFNGLLVKHSVCNLLEQSVSNQPVCHLEKSLLPLVVNIKY